MTEKQTKELEIISKEIQAKLTGIRELEGKASRIIASAAEGKLTEEEQKQQYEAAKAVVDQYCNDYYKEEQQQIQTPHTDDAFVKINNSKIKKISRIFRKIADLLDEFC